jgi:hypothetical protein
MADHRIDVDAVEDPMQLLGRKRDDRLLATRPSELVLGQPLQDQHKAGPIEEQELHPVAPTRFIMHPSVRALAIGQLYHIDNLHKSWTVGQPHPVPLSEQPLRSVLQ